MEYQLKVAFAATEQFWTLLTTLVTQTGVLSVIEVNNTNYTLYRKNSIN